MSRDNEIKNDKFSAISDEQLSAFLDAELSEAEMEMIREQLIDDENIANRLAELAMVDELVAMSFSTIDARPLPDAINKLLTQDENETAKIIAFPFLKKIRQQLPAYSAVAAGVALIVGFGLTQTLTKDSTNWQSVAQILEHSESGIEQLSMSGIQVKPRLTFLDKENDYCRQFSMVDKNEASENIACRKNNTWELAEHVVIKNIQQAGTYQTASGGSVLDEQVEQMIDGDFFDAQAESDAISQHWNKTKKPYR